MSAQSLASLLEHMEQGSVTEGWGAISVFNRAQLNRLLEQQYIERFNDLTFIPPFIGDISMPDRSGTAELSSIALGKPLLSFVTSSVRDSRALLTMNIIAGTYMVKEQRAGVAERLASTTTISEQLGYQLEMEIDLSLVVGKVDRRGTVTLDLAQAVNFSCNLAGTDAVTNAHLAAFFQQSFAELPKQRSVFNLGMLNLDSYGRLTPVRFRIATQAAPGAKIRGASNYGEGAVVVFISLQGSLTDGTFPPSASFPYLIPDDQESDGSDRYSASVILSKDMLPIVACEQPEVLTSLLFPGANVFAERDRYTPHDLVSFGSISPLSTSLRLEPLFKTIKAGEAQQFKLFNGDGEAIEASDWEALSLEAHTPEGHGTIAAGLYIPPTQDTIGYSTVHVRVTATYIKNAITYTTSALLLVVFDSLTVSPAMSSSRLRANAQPESIMLTGASLDGADLTWSLLPPAYGSLTQQQEKNRTLFTPDARATGKSLVAQQVEVSGPQTRQTSLVLINGQQLLRIDPPHVAGLSTSAKVQLQDDSTLLPGMPRRWTVISGGGSVTETGVFSAPAQRSTLSSIVLCEIVHNGVVFSSGYNVIEPSELKAEPNWISLSEFSLRIPGGSNNGHDGQVFRNGYQQLKVEITTQTAAVDTVYYPLSTIEKASMRLVDNISKADIPFLDEGQIGIPETDERVWQTSLSKNRFDLALPTGVLQDNRPSAESGDTGRSVQELYIHTRADQPLKMHATFQDRNNKWWASSDSSAANTTIEVIPRPIPTFLDAEYSFKRDRVEGGSGAPGDPEEDDFSFHLRTLDYWQLGYAGVKFVTLEFLPVNDGMINTSMIRWESEQLAETMFSWTGYAFNDEQKVGDATNLHFDDSLCILLGAKRDWLDVPIDASVFETGKLTISLHRHDEFNYIRSGTSERDLLSRSIAVLLMDNMGNTHKRRISFLPPDEFSARNHLRHTLFTPDGFGG